MVKSPTTQPVRPSLFTLVRFLRLIYVHVDDFNTANGVTAGNSYSGDAVGGRGRNRGPGGNASTGRAGASNGGNIGNEGGTVTNTNSSESHLNRET